MQLSASPSVEEVAAIVANALTSAGITAVLSGGAAVQIYTSVATSGRQPARSRVGRAAGRCAANTDPDADAVRDGPACGVGQ